MISPNACKSVVACISLFPLSRTTSPRLLARPSGVMAQSTYVRYSSPNLFAGSMPFSFASISKRPVLLSTFASPAACSMSSVPRRSTLVDPPRCLVIHCLCSACDNIGSKHWCLFHRFDLVLLSDTDSDTIEARKKENGNEQSQFVAHSVTS